MDISIPKGINPTQLSPEQKEMIGKMMFKLYPELKFTHLLIGASLDMVLCGCMIVLFILWSINQRDSTLLRVLVYSVCASEFTHTIYTMTMTIVWFGNGHGTYAQFVSPLPIWQCAFSCIVPFVQTFYFFRVCKISRHAKWLGLILLPLGLGCLGGVLGVITTYYMYPLDVNKIVTTAILMLRLFDGCTMGIDLIITGAMTYGLLRSKTGWHDTDKLINRLVIMTAETMLPATILAILIMGMTVHKFSFLPMMFASFYPKVVVVTFLTVLLSAPGTTGYRNPTEIHVEVSRTVLTQQGVNLPRMKKSVNRDYDIPLVPYPMSNPQFSETDLAFDAASMGKNSDLGEENDTHDMAEKGRR